MHRGRTRKEADFRAQNKKANTTHNVRETYSTLEHCRIILPLRQIIHAKVPWMLLLEQIRDLISVVSIRGLHARRWECHGCLQRGIPRVSDDSRETSKGRSKGGERTNHAVGNVSEVQVVLVRHKAAFVARHHFPKEVHGVELRK